MPVDKKIQKQRNAQKKNKKVTKSARKKLKR